MKKHNVEGCRVGYARYVDDIILLADSASLLEEFREVVDRTTRELQLTLHAKADAIPPMTADEFIKYINQGRALAASGPAWEPPLVGDGEAGWEHWSPNPSADRQSALQLLHNGDLYRQPGQQILQTVRTAFLAADLRTSELPKAARLIWYAVALDSFPNSDSEADAQTVWNGFYAMWRSCAESAPWRLNATDYQWEAVCLFALEGLERLFDTASIDIPLLSSEENFVRRQLIHRLARVALTADFGGVPQVVSEGPVFQRTRRWELVRWKANKIVTPMLTEVRTPESELARLFAHWRPFDWLHEAVARLLSISLNDEDPLQPFVHPFRSKVGFEDLKGNAERLLVALLPDGEGAAALAPTQQNSLCSIALQTLVSAAPRERLLQLLNRRPHLLANGKDDLREPTVILPPLPGIDIPRLFACRKTGTSNNGVFEVDALRVVELTNDAVPSVQPKFLGSSAGKIVELSPAWTARSLEGSGGVLQRLDAELASDSVLRLRERARSDQESLDAVVLAQAASLFRSVSSVVARYNSSEAETTGKELVPAWPYIAMGRDEQALFLICDGVPGAQLGGMAFLRDGGRALRTIEVPNFDAYLWRTGVAISDYLGLHDDITKFSSPGAELPLDAHALSDPARYVLRSQLKKLRGAYANSQTGKRVAGGQLPSSVERTLSLLENFPANASDRATQLVHILATEAETAAMQLSFQRQWRSDDPSLCLRLVASKVLGKLPLAIAQGIAAFPIEADGLRRDLVGVLCLARRLCSAVVDATSSASTANRVLRAGIVCTGISVALQGCIASLRSHPDYSRYESADFPSDWSLPPPMDQRPEGDRGNQVETSNRDVGVALENLSLLDQLRRLVQHLGYRIRPTDASGQLSQNLKDKLKTVALSLARLQVQGEGSDGLEWPYLGVRESTLRGFDISLLEGVVGFVRSLDAELGFEVKLVKEHTYGFNAQTKRFVDSRNRTWEVAPWMISQFPKQAKQVEEILKDGKVVRVWTEVTDRRSGNLLSVSVLGEPFASIAISDPDVGALQRVAGDEALAVRFDESGTPTANLAPDAGASESILPRRPPITNLPNSTEHSSPSDRLSKDGSLFGSQPQSQKGDRDEEKGRASPDEATLHSTRTSFRRQQISRWSERAKATKNQARVRVESPRLSRRLKTLRGLSHEQVEQVFARGA